MELIDNVNKTLKDDLTVSIQKDSKVSIAAACFSIYAFQELKRELRNVDELRFIFTSPTFVQEKAKKEKREFYIPRQARERSLYGSEFEVKLRNEMTQRAIAKECAEWMPAENANVKLSGLDLDAVWESLVTQVSGIVVSDNNSLDEQIVIEQEKSKLMKQIEDLEKKARKETQAKKKFEMFQRLKAYQKRLEEM